MSGPRARSHGLIVEALDDEWLIYDEVEQTAHCLDHRLALVFQSCDGRSVDDVSARVAEALGEAVSREWVEAALAALARAGLVEWPKRSSRRRFAAAAVAVGLTSVAVPAAAQSGSCIGFGQPCMPGLCCPGLRCAAGFCVPL